MNRSVAFTSLGFVTGAIPDSDIVGCTSLYGCGLCGAVVLDPDLHIEAYHAALADEAFLRGGPLPPDLAANPAVRSAIAAVLGLETDGNWGGR